MSSSRQVPFPQDESSIRSADGKVSLDDLFTRLYDKIHGLAARVRWSGTNPTLNPTALAHEAYIKLRKSSPQVTAETNKEAIGIFANAMHQILIDAARRKNAQKRLEIPASASVELPIEDALTVAASLERLERENPRQADIVRCRFLLGMTAGETAAALVLSQRTVEREWQHARDWLSRHIQTAPG